MPTTRDVIGQATLTSVPLAPVALEMAELLDLSVAINFSTAVIAEHSHDPPISGSPAVLPLRI